MANRIACRIASYGKHQDAAWEHLPEVGITHMEIPAPPPDQVDAVTARLAKHGLSASSLQATILLADAAWEAASTETLDICQAMHVPLLLAIVRPGELPRDEVWQRLRRVGDIAQTRNVTLMLETHPDLATNGEVARATMLAVTHPHIRINFDTANIYFYNEGRDSLTDLAMVADWVVGVHLKDSRGLLRTFDFPVLGEGIIDFRKVFALLGERGFTGPCTMELEVAHDVDLDLAGRKQRVTNSVAYLRKIGAMA